MNDNSSEISRHPSSILNFVVEADFSSRDLTGTSFFDVLPEFIRIQRLILDDCNIRYLPSEVASMKRLEELHVRRNKIVNFKIDFNHLSNLKVLCSDSNLLYDAAFPESLYKCYWLIVLDFSSNLFAKIPPKINRLFGLSLLNFSNNINLDIQWDLLSKNIFLRHLILKNCRISSIPPSIKSLSGLVGLDLSNNKITSNNLENLAYLKNLKYLYLNNINCDEKSLNYVSNRLSNLKELYMRDNKLKNLSDQICMFKKLKILDLSNNQINKISSLIDCFLRLEILVLSNNELESLEKNILNMPLLRKLYLNANYLTFESIPKQFDNLTNLELLDVSENPIRILPESLNRCLSLKIIKVQYMDMIDFPSFSMLPNLDIRYEGTNFVKKIVERKKYESISMIHVKIDLDSELQKNGIKLEDNEKKSFLNNEHFENIQRQLFESKHSKHKDFLESLNIQNEGASFERNKKMQSNENFEPKNQINGSNFNEIIDYRNCDMTDNLFEKAKYMPEGYLMWYIDSFSPKYLNPKDYGKFFLQEAFIVYHKYFEDDICKSAIYVWKGINAPKEKAPSASLFALSLKNAVDYTGKIHYEDCYDESPNFKHIFDFDLNYIDECITSSSLRSANAKKTTPPKLYKILTDKYFRVIPVSSKSKMPENPSKSFFVIKDDSNMICWAGSNTSNVQRIQVQNLLRSWNSNENKSSITPQIVIQDDINNIIMKKFNSLKDSIPKEEFFIDAKLDETYNCLFKIDLDTNSGIKIAIEQQYNGFYSRSLLDSKFVYILDTNSTSYLWIGLLASFYLKVASYSILDAFFDIYPKPEYSESIIEFEKSESFLFNQYFLDDNLQKNILSFTQDTYDLVSGDLLISRQPEFTKEQFDKDSKRIDETLSFMQIFVFDSSKGHYVLLPDDEYGMFYDENTYFIVTKFEENNTMTNKIEERLITYIWQGKHASKKGIFDFNFEWKPKLVKEFKGNMKFEFINHELEFYQFLMLFNRLFIVICGKNYEKSDHQITNINDNNQNDCNLSNYMFFEIRSTAGYSHLRCQQITPRNLISNFVYIIVYQNQKESPKVFIWKGIFSKIDDYKDAQVMAERISIKLFGSIVDIEHLFESKESKEFTQIFQDFLSDTNIILNSKETRLFKIKFDSLNKKIIIKDCGLDFTKSRLKKSFYIFDDGTNLNIICRSKSLIYLNENQIVYDIAKMYQDFIKLTSKRLIKSIIIHQNHQESEILKYYFHGWN